MSSYVSGFSDLIEKYESYQKASDSWSENANGLNIKYFDHYCTLHYPGQPLCQEMVDEWCRKRETETNASCFTRTGGIRTTEARYLKREDVDLEHGVLNIRKSKGYDQHYVALHESMTELLKQYDKAAESIRSDCTYFFETPNGKYYSRQWVTQTFQCLWEKANGKQNKAVAYDLRHNYAVVNINHWADDTFEFDQKLHYLSKSMGHRSIDSTLYYYSITPCLADILLKKTEKSFNELLPEVGYEEI